jgi:hypothetical protein
VTGVGAGPCGLPGALVTWRIASAQAGLGHGVLGEAVLRMPVAFVAAMGSHRTHADRDRRLREAGLTERESARPRSPIGLP